MRSWLAVVVIAAVAAMLISGFFPAAVSAYSGNNTTQLESNISLTCGLSTNATVLVFGNMTTGEISAIQSINVTNIGSTDTTDLQINGTNWIMGGGPNFENNATHWSNTGGFSYDAGSYVNRTPTSMAFNLANNQSQVVNFRVKVPLGQSAGLYNQSIAITSTC